MPKTKAKVRMFRLHELGDCFLVTFTTGKKRAHMLVDCGSFRNSEASKQRLGEVTAAIRKEIGKDKLTVVVGTHQHNDHLSGFLHCEPDFQKMKIGQVWLSWLDNPRDTLGRKIGDDFNNLRSRLAAAAGRMRAVKGASPQAQRSLEVVQDMLGFFGATDKDPPEVPANAMKVLKKLGDEDPEYLRPGKVFDMPGLPANSVRVHVLGPPRDDESLFRTNPKTNESYDHSLANALRMVTTFLRALDGSETASKAAPGEQQYPFNEQYKCTTGKGNAALAAVRARYAEKQWRTIDDDWMSQAEGLALYMDTYTNNSSLVLALELVESGKVLLFAADAQAGNWSSWKDVKWPAGHPGTESLLRRTVFYKVGHHASHNATLVQAFEAMGGEDLCALIPVHKDDPNIKKKNGWKMPAKNLYKRLIEKTKGRTLRMDGADDPECDLGAAQVKKAWKEAGIVAKSSTAVIELLVS